MSVSLVQPSPYSPQTKLDKLAKEYSELHNLFLELTTQLEQPNANKEDLAARIVEVQSSLDRKGKMMMAIEFFSSKK